MPYSAFTLVQVVEQFRLEVREVSGLFSAYPARPISDHLLMTLERFAPIALKVGTEKMRSESIIAPVLWEVWQQCGESVGFFSGVDFTVDVARGLNGVCDYLFSLSPLQSVLLAPVVAVVEAKKEDITVGVGQCVAVMVAVQTYNVARNRPLPHVCGAVTMGNVWRFVQLSGSVVEIEAEERYITEVGQIVGILVGVIQAARQTEKVQTMAQ